MNDPASKAHEPVDLGRLRIERAGESGRRVRGFNWLWVFLLLGLVGAGWLFREPLLAALEGATGSGLPAVRTARVERVVPGQAAEGDVAANGYVVANRSASLATVLSGRLVELNAQEGDVVEENAVVARIQFDDLEAQELEAKKRTLVAAAHVAESNAALAAARMDVPRLEAQIEVQRRLAAEAKENADRLARDVERNRPLFAAKRIDAATWDRLQADARGAKRAEEAVEAQVAAIASSLTAWNGEISRREAQLAVDVAGEAAARQTEQVAALLVEKTRIRAPFRGLVIRKDAEKGEVIAPTGGGANSRGSVLTIVDPTSLEVQVDLPERRIARVAEGDRALVFLDAEPEKALPGAVRKVWPRADRSKGTIELRITIEGKPAWLRPEMAARVVFKGAHAGAVEAPYVAVAAEALATRGDRSVVFLVEGDVVRVRVVKAGAPQGDRVRIDEGLSGGETVVLGPPATLKEGDRVKAQAGS